MSQRLTPEEIAQLSEEEELAALDVVNREALAALNAGGLLNSLRLAACAYFQTVLQGKSYKRSPKTKITITDPVLGEKKLEYKTHIAPFTSTWGGRCTVYPQTIVVSLVHCVPNAPKKTQFEAKLVLFLAPESKVQLALHQPHTARADLERIGRLVAGFLRDPDSALAASGTDCAFCGRLLTDPESRRRGYGPECVKKRGDLIRHIAIYGPPKSRD
jgi:hypothetical protein